MILIFFFNNMFANMCKIIAFCYDLVNQYILVHHQEIQNIFYFLYIFFFFVIQDIQLVDVNFLGEIQSRFERDLCLPFFFVVHKQNKKICIVTCNVNCIRCIKEYRGDNYGTELFLIVFFPEYIQKNTNSLSMVYA